MRVGQARKRDWNELAIVTALRAIGVEVRRISAPGVPDLLTYSRGVWLPIEVKRPRGKLTPEQQALMTVAPYPVVESVDEALELFGIPSLGGSRGASVGEPAGPGCRVIPRTAR